MSSRTTKRSVPPTPTRRTTRRGISSVVEADAELTQFGPVPVRDDSDEDDAAAGPESAASARPTRRDIAVPAVAIPRTRSRSRSMRGEFSIASARGIPTDEVAGSIDVPSSSAARRRRPTTQQQPRDTVRLISATKRQLTVELHGKPLTLERPEALALAQLILTAFA